MAVLLIADVNEGALATDQVAKALAAVAGLGEVHVLVAGMGGDAAAAEAATLQGVTKVLFADDHAYCHGMGEPTAALVAGLAAGYSHICGAATAFNKNVLPRVAALLDVMVMSDVTAVLDADTFERPIYAGNAVQTVKSTDAQKGLFGAHRRVYRRWRGRVGCGRKDRRAGRCGSVGLGRGPGCDLGPPRTDQRRDRGVGRARCRVQGKL